MKISKAQEIIHQAYGEKDRKRGTPGTFMYLVEEVGELSTALREEGKEERASELADVFAWTLSVAALEGIDLEKSFLEKYKVCSGCGKAVCSCDTKP
jgi:NTP pyrophosphatase (non-canonical NTP hydrolase)